MFLFTKKRRLCNYTDDNSLNAIDQEIDQLKVLFPKAKKILSIFIDSKLTLDAKKAVQNNVLESSPLRFLVSLQTSN